MLCLRIGLYSFVTVSLLTWQDLVIVPFDQGDAEDHLSKISAFDGATGKMTFGKRSARKNRSLKLQLAAA